MARSRVNQRLVKQTERNLLFIILGGILLLVLFLFFGGKLLVNFSLFVEKKNEVAAQDSETIVMIPPILDYLPDATNSARLDISGSATTGKYVKLYHNGKQEKKADIKEDGTFVIKGITLAKGENELKVKAVDDHDKESKFSDTSTVLFSTDAPDLTVNSPSDGQNYHIDNNPLRVTGKTNASNKVTVNDFWAMVDDDGNFTYNLPLKNGDNEIKIVATDEAGNKSEKTIKVSYSE